MTSEAFKAFADAGLSRRDFLKTSGALVVSFTAAAAIAPPRQGLLVIHRNPTSCRNIQVSSGVAGRADHFAASICTGATSPPQSA